MWMLHCLFVDRDRCHCLQGDAEQFWSANLRIRPGPRGERPTCIPLRLYVVHPAEGMLGVTCHEADCSRIV